MKQRILLTHLVELYRPLLEDLDRFSCGTFRRIISFYDHGTIEYDNNTPNSVVISKPIRSPTATEDQQPNTLHRRDTWSTVDRDEEDYFSSASSDQEDDEEEECPNETMMEGVEETTSFQTKVHQHAKQEEGNFALFRLSPPRHDFKDEADDDDYNNHYSPPTPTQQQLGAGLTHNGSPKSPVHGRVDEVSEDTLPLFHDDTL